MRNILLALILLMVLAPVANVHSATISLGTGYSYQDEGTLSWDDTAGLRNLDGSWGPTTTGTVIMSYYATGTSDWYFDAISAAFDLSAIGYQNVQPATIWAYIETGLYPDHNWHHYELYEGA